MRVKIGNYWLAGNPSLTEREHSQCGFPIFTPQRNSQRTQGLRWATAKFKDRQNAAHSFDFSTTRLFATFQARLAFIAGYMTAHDWEGAVTIREDIDALTYYEYQLGGAVITPPQMSPVGVSLTLQYHIEFSTYGSVVTGAYADSSKIGDESAEQVLDEGGGGVIEET